MKCSECFCKYFSKIKCFDTFPVSTALRSNGDDSYKTWIGFVASLGYYCLLLWAIITIGTNVLSKSNPNTQEAERVISSPNPTNFTPDAFPIVFGIETKDPTEFFIDETVYVPLVQQKLRFKNGSNSIVTSLPAVPCDSSRHAIVGELKDYFQTQITTQPLYCVDVNTSIYGEFAAPEFQYIRIAFGICANTTENNNHCQPLETIVSKLKIGYVSLFLPSYNRDLGNYTHPMSTIGENTFTTISYNYTKVIDIYYEEHLIYTDHGTLYTIYENESFDVVSKHTEMLDLIPNPKRFIYFDIKMSTLLKEYYRDYAKVINFISDLGGFIQIIFVVLFFVVGPITDFLYLVNLLNVMYRRKDKPVIQGDVKNSDFFKSISSNDNEGFGLEFEKKSNIKFKMDTSSNKSAAIKKMNSKPLLMVPQSKFKDLSPDVDNKYDMKIEIPEVKIRKEDTVPFGTSEPVTMYNLGSTKEMDMLEKRLKSKLTKTLNRVTFSMNICQFMWYKFKSIINFMCKKCESSSDKRYDNWFDKVESKIEITYVLNKLREIDKLKLVLLSKDQLILFNYLTKPIISESESKDYSEKLWDIVENPDDYHGEAFQAFERLRQSSMKTDRKFLQLIDEETRNELLPQPKNKDQ